MSPALWCRDRDINALHAGAEVLDAFLTERARPGLTFGTLDG
jgi:hypothetical protein